MQSAIGLYHPRHEHDACGVGFVANIDGSRDHRVVELGILAVINLTHRGAVDADARTGDGAGILTQLPLPLFSRVLKEMGSAVPATDLGVGMIFLPGQDAAQATIARAALEEAAAHYGIPVIGWRVVPVDPSVLGDKALATQPRIEQLLLQRPPATDDTTFERLLYFARRRAENAVWGQGIPDFYVPSMSCRTIVYKGLLVAPQMPSFYPDLTDPDFTSAVALFHQRYSTNTFPNWALAQPFRYLGHNGEINTLQGNRNWMRARESSLANPTLDAGLADITPVIWDQGSDSASLDNALELLTLGGRDIMHSSLMLVPEAWESMPSLDGELRSFYQYHATLQEPWDGPAALAWTDGTIVGATLDRNGLRPARYKITTDGLIVLASEVGVLGLDDSTVAEKGKLGPGEMLAVDLGRGVLLRNDDIKFEAARRAPYSTWVHRSILDFPRHLERQSGRKPFPVPDPADMVVQRAFDFTQEEKHFIQEPQVVEGKEATFSMGNDTPMAVLSRRTRLIYDYFAQKFAQVTNPPIDPLREQLVMSLDVYLGPRGNLLTEEESHARLLRLPSPILLDHELNALRALPEPHFRSATLDATFPIIEGAAGLRRRLQELRDEAERLVRNEGVHLLIVSDRDISDARAPVPSLLAIGAIHHHLIRAGIRMQASLIAETGDAREPHAVACLLGYGASAVNPWLALSMAVAFARDDDDDNVDEWKACRHIRSALDAGLLKIMSKMGISALSSYTGAQIFEAVGIASSLVDECFAGTDSPIEGAGLDEFALDVLARHETAFGDPSVTRLDDFGLVRYRKNGEYHAYNPVVIKALHKAVRNESFEAYSTYKDMVNGRDPVAVRDLLEFVSDRQPIPLDDVEPVEKIVARFNTAAMSMGALSPEAHETIAIAMNRLGAKSNTGEGGEDHDFYTVKPNGDTADSKIKQVASARFGVTPEYLSRAQEIQIKMAQGSKPGEGGQLPGFKINAHIARIRHSVPGVPLISPPPHHDIYSIEDLAQLIYDLKITNPRARVNVKLVAESGVGTVAAGVAKAYADVVHISGHDGGTGASPLSSIKHAGQAWELGLAETQQVLILNGLRDRIKVTVDGGFKTGRDVVVAALLGAEEYGFGTAALVAAGCLMARQCHLNTCPVGVATQREDLRAKFDGTPEMVVSLFTFVAQEVRMILAELGYASLDELIGRVDLLRQTRREDLPRWATVDLSRLLANVNPDGSLPRKSTGARNDRDDVPLDDTLVRDAKDAIEHRHRLKLQYPIRNTDRTVGARLSGEIAWRYGDGGLPDRTVDIEFRGSAGQSFGAFGIKGVRLTLVGEANDYVGKGLGGAELIVRPTENAAFVASENVIIGNTCLYGATSGTLYAAGRAGERFAVRNSGATAVVEGVGDHACEYMTGGTVVVLGPTGRNFGAGMSNGIAYVYDPEDDFATRINSEMIGIERIGADGEDLKALVRKHFELTRSEKARQLLDSWNEAIGLFWKVVPHPAREIAKRDKPEKAAKVA